MAFGAVWSVVSLCLVWCASASEDIERAKVGASMVYINHANYQFSKQNFDASATLFGLAWDLDPANYAALANRSLAYLKLNSPVDDGKALSDAQNCMRLRPTFGLCHFVKGMVLFRQSRDEEAFSLMEKGLELETDAASIDALLRMLNQVSVLRGLREEMQTSASGVEALRVLDSIADTPLGNVEPIATQSIAVEPATATTASSSILLGAQTIGSSEQSAPMPPKSRFANQLPVQDETVRFEEMAQWLRECGADIGHLDVRHYSAGYRGVHSNSTLNMGDQLLFVPHECMVTSYLAKHSTNGRRLVEAGYDSDTVLLALFILEDSQNATSRFQPYYNVLPRTLDSNPLMWPSSLQNSLRGSTAATVLRETQSLVQQSFEFLASALPKFNATISFDDFRWAFVMAMSRNFEIVGAADNTTNALVPLADMLNHNLTPSVRWGYEPKQKGFKMTVSSEGITLGSVVTDSYGAKSNARYLVYYGFTMPGLNCRQPTIDDNASLLANNIEGSCMDVVELVSNRSEGLNSMSLGHEVNDPKRARLIFSKLRVRAVLALDYDIADWSFALDVDTDLVGPIDVKSERRALESLSQAIDEQLALYPTPISEDEDFLKSRAGSPIANVTDFNERNLHTVLRSEKHILHQYRELINTALPILDLSPTHASVTTRQVVSANPQIQWYISEVAYALVLRKPFIVTLDRLPQHNSLPRFLADTTSTDVILDAPRPVVSINVPISRNVATADLGFILDQCSTLLGGPDFGNRYSVGARLRMNKWRAVKSPVEMSTPDALRLLSTAGAWESLLRFDNVELALNDSAEGGQVWVSRKHLLAALSAVTPRTFALLARETADASLVAAGLSQEHCSPLLEAVVELIDATASQTLAKASKQ